MEVSWKAKANATNKVFARAVVRRGEHADITAPHHMTKIRYEDHITRFGVVERKIGRRIGRVHSRQIRAESACGEA